MPPDRGQADLADADAAVTRFARPHPDHVVRPEPAGDHPPGAHRLRPEPDWLGRPQIPLIGAGCFAHRPAQILRTGHGQPEGTPRVIADLGLLLAEPAARQVVGSLPG